MSAPVFFTAPAGLPNSHAITISSAAAADSSASATSNVTLWNATPALSNVTPTTFNTGTYTLTVTGSNFVSGAQVLFGGAAVNTAFVSSTKLTATGSEASAGIFGVSVSNPNPGSSTSSAINVTVTSQSGGNPPPPPPAPSACSAISLGQGGSLNGFLPFPADNLWNQNIANATVDPNSAAIINFIGPTDPVHPDFGSGEFDGSIIGIPYIVVDSDQAPVAINFTAVGDESDTGPTPAPGRAPTRGGGGARRGR